MKGEKILKNIEDGISRQYPNISRWMEAMKSLPMNNMVLHSFVREFVFNNFNIAEFCKKFEGFLKENDLRIDDHPLTIYQKFINENFVEKKNLLNGKPIKKARLTGKVSHFLGAYKFYHSILGGGDEARGPRERLNLKKKRIFRLMIENKLSPAEMSHWKGELKGESDITWFTKYDSIPQEYRECSDDPEAAKKIRDLLGLAHIFSDGLIEVQIPKELVENGSRVPTICETAGYPYFRPAKRVDGFGRAIDLDKKNTGLPEAVHDKITWDGNFNPPRYVGDLSGEKIEFSDPEWQQVTTVSETDLIAFIKGVNNEA